jgi:cyanobactin cluster PatC/TenC/TruC protein
VLGQPNSTYWLIVIRSFIEEIKNHFLATGLEDYRFWWQEMAKKKAAQSEPEQPFRRGRIWS